MMSGTTTALRLLIAYAFALIAVQRSPIVSTIDVEVMTPPALVMIAGQRYLVYELHLTNFRASDVTLTSVEILDADRGARLVILPDARRIAAAQHAVVYVWSPLNANVATPARLRHRLTLQIAAVAASKPEPQPQTPQPQTLTETVEIAPIAVRTDPPLVLDPPLRGGPWVALYDPHLPGGHRTTIYALAGRAHIAARFAIDWVLLANDGTHAHGDATQIANWYGYGADILAVADAIVVEAKDDIPESPTLPPPGTPHARVPLENVSGNFITLDLGQSRFAFYEHLKPHSLRVKPGDHVTRGQILAALGNSGGSSDGPHLHFHIADTQEDLAAEGVPYAFRTFDIIGAYKDIAAFTQNHPWSPAPPTTAGVHRNELPPPNVIVNFPK
jgi:murein DD-endopeptidase